MSDQWGPLPIAQQFPASAPDGIAKLLDIIKRMQTDITESRASILASVAKIVADLTAKQATLDAQQATLTTTVASLSTTQATLTTTVSDLATAQATLTTQQASLTSQLASINTLIGQQTTGVAAAPGTGSGFNVSTSQATKASTTITVPSGYTQALVMAVGSLTMADVAANRFDTRCGIAGNYGAALPNLANTVGSTSAAHTRTLTGLSTGGTITLEVQALAAVSATNAANTAIVTGFAIFFR